MRIGKWRGIQGEGGGEEVGERDTEGVRERGNGTWTWMIRIVGSLGLVSEEEESTGRVCDLLPSKRGPWGGTLWAGLGRARELERRREKGRDGAGRWCCTFFPTHGLTLSVNERGR